MAERTPVLVVAPCPFPLDRGTPIRIQRLATLMSARYDVHVATFHQGRRGALPYRVHRIPWLPFDLTQSSGASLGKVFCDFALLWLVLWVVVRHRVRIVDGHLHEGALLGLLARALTGCRVAYNSHGTLAREMVAAGHLREGGFPARRLQAFEDWIERRCDAIVAQSTMRRDEFVAKRGIDPARVVLVEDAPLFETYGDAARDADLERRYRDRFDCVFVYSGELMPYQGVDMVLDALPRVLAERPRTGLVLFGRPAEAYRERIAREGLAASVEVVDHEPFERLPAYLALADVALAPRLYGGNVPGKLPIYMAAGCCVLGSDTPGINTVIEHGVSGWLAAPDAASVADAMLRLAADSDLRRRLGTSALAEARRRYAPERIEEAMEAVYSRLGGGRTDA